MDHGAPGCFRLCMTLLGWDGADTLGWNGSDALRWNDDDALGWIDDDACRMSV